MSTCGDCAFWERMSEAQGGCHRNPPQVTAVVLKGYASREALDTSDGTYFNSTFPETKHDEWCGEFVNRPPPRPPQGTRTAPPRAPAPTLG